MIGLWFQVELTSAALDRSRLPGGWDRGRLVLETPSFEAAMAAVREVRRLNPDVIEHVELKVLYAYEGQCNLAFSEVEIAVLASEQVSLSISCWPED